MQGVNEQTSIYEWLVQIPVLITIKLGVRQHALHYTALYSSGCGATQPLG